MVVFCKRDNEHLRTYKRWSISWLALGFMACPEWHCHLLRLNAVTSRLKWYYFFAELKHRHLAV